MSDQKPTNGNGDDPRPSASPQVNEDEILHKSILFSTDPVHQYFKKRDAVPEQREESPADEQPEADQPVETDQSPVTEISQPVPAADEQIEAIPAVVETEGQSTFIRWLQKKPQPQVSITDLTKPETRGPEPSESVEEKPRSSPKSGKKKKKKKRKKKKKSAAQKARKKNKRPDFSLGDDIFSETLADLLATQGFTKKAIQMYERLSLIYPEKSRLFAAKIEELKKIE